DFNEFRSADVKSSIPYKYKGIKATYPVSVDMLIKLNYDEIPDSLSALQSVNRDNFRDMIAGDATVDSMFNLNELDSFMKKELHDAGIDKHYGFGFADAEGNIVYAKRISDSSLLDITPYKTSLFSG